MKEGWNPVRTDPNITDDAFFEARKKQHLTVAGFFKAVDKENIVESTEAKEKFISDLSYEAFEKWLIRTNGMFRGLSTKERGLDGKEGVRILDPFTEEPIYNPPFPEDRQELLGKVLLALKRMGPSADSAAMLGTSINAIHPFADANGRTARFLYGLIASSKGNFDLRDVTPDEIQLFVEGYVRSGLHGVEIPEYTTADDMNLEELEDDKEGNPIRRTFYNAYYYDKDTMTAALDIFCRENGTDFKFALLDDGDTLSFKNFFKITKVKAIEEIVRIYRKLKKEYVETIIDVFENPSRYPLSKMIPQGTPGREEVLEAAPKGTLKDAFFVTTGGRHMVKTKQFSWDELIKLYESAKNVDVDNA